MSDEPGMPSGNGVRITNREIYDMVVQLKDELRESKGVLREEIAKVQVEMHGENEDVLELMTRVRSLELKFYGLLAGLVGAIIILLRVGSIGFG